MSKIYKVARAGKSLGDFQLWELKEALQSAKLQWSDDYWHTGMPNWAKLESIRALILASQKPTTTTPPPPLPPPASGPQAPSQPKPELSDGQRALIAIGLIVGGIGGLVLLSGLTSDPSGSAIRQGVLAQHMTNGILLMILGVLIAKR